METKNILVPFRCSDEYTDATHAVLQITEATKEVLYRILTTVRESDTKLRDIKPHLVSWRNFPSIKVEITGLLRIYVDYSNEGTNQTFSIEEPIEPTLIDNMLGATEVDLVSTEVVVFPDGTIEFSGWDEYTSSQHYEVEFDFETLEKFCNE